MYDALRLSYWVWLKKVAWSLTPASWVETRRLQAFHNIHRGERCFIMGTGPSLRAMNLAPLQHEYTIGVNRLYLLFPELGFTTTYFTAMDPHFMRLYADDIATLTMPCFLLWFGRQYIAPAPNYVWIHDHPRPHFTTDPTRWMWGSQTVTFTALQLAYYMGFEQVILIGVDHSFAAPVPQPAGHAAVPVPHAGDYFTSTYVAHDTRNMAARNLKQWELAYELARTAYERDGREVLDATVGGKLRVFPKVAYETLV